MSSNHEMTSKTIKTPTNLTLQRMLWKRLEWLTNDEVRQPIGILTLFGAYKFFGGKKVLKDLEKLESWSHQKKSLEAFKAENVEKVINFASLLNVAYFCLYTSQPYSVFNAKNEITI